MKRTVQLFVLAVCAGATAGAQAGEGSADAAKDKIPMCVGCHGIAGYRTAFPSVYHVPKLGGQHQAYIVAALQAYKKGDRSHPTMQAIAESLSDKEMADIAAYYGAQK